MSYVEPACQAQNLWVHHHVLASVGSNDNNNDRSGKYFFGIFFIDTWSILLLDNEVDFNENLHFRPSFSKDGFYSGYDINGNDVNFYINQIN